MSNCVARLFDGVPLSAEVSQNEWEILKVIKSFSKYTGLFQMRSTE